MIKIIRRASISDTLRSMAEGESRVFEARRFADLNAIRVACHRANKKTGYVRYTVQSHSNGAAYTITCKPKG